MRWPRRAFTPGVCVGGVGEPQLGSVQPITAGGPVRGPTPAPTPTGMLVLGYILNAGVWGKYTHTNKDKARCSEELEST